MKKFVLALSLMFCSSAAFCQNFDLKVQISDILQAKGKIRMVVYNKASAYMKKGQEYRTAILDVTGNTVNHTFKDLPPGEYAVALYHDENNDGRCNTNLFGIPTEGYAFSNNYKPKFGAPDYSDISLRLESNKNLNLRLLHFEFF